MILYESNAGRHLTAKNTANFHNFAGHIISLAGIYATIPNTTRRMDITTATDMDSHMCYADAVAPSKKAGQRHATLSDRQLRHLVR